MTQTQKISLGVIIAILVITLIYVCLPTGSSSKSLVATSTADISSSTDTSEASLIKDMSDLDTQLSGLEGAQKDVDASLTN